MLPREHGAWAVLAAPIAVGFAAAGGGTPGLVLSFLCAALGAFCARTPLQALLSPAPSPGSWFWLAAYSLLAAGGVVPLLLVFDRWGLLAFAVPGAAAMAFNLRQNLTRKALSLSNEIIGIGALCLGAPGAYYCARGEAPFEAWAAWAVCLGYFLGPVFHVKMAALQHRAASDPSFTAALGRARRNGAAYHGAALAASGVGAFAGWLPWAAVIPFAAALEKNHRAGARSPGKVNFKRLGYQEVGYSLFFIAALAFGYR